MDSGNLNDKDLRFQSIAKTRDLRVCGTNVNYCRADRERVGKFDLIREIRGSVRDDAGARGQADESGGMEGTNCYRKATNRNC